MRKQFISCFIYLFSSLLMFAGFSSMAAPIIVIIAPVPFAMLTLRFGVAAGLVASISAWFTAFCLAGFEASCVYMIEFALLGICLGYLLRKCELGGDYVMRAISVSVCAKLGIAFLLFHFTGVNPWAFPTDIPNETLSLVQKILSSSMDTVSPEDVKSYIESLSASASLMMPSMLIFLSAADAMVCYWVAGRLSMKHSELKIPDMPPFKEWRFPRNIFIALLFTLFVDLAVKIFPNVQLLKVIWLNIMEILRALFIVQALSACWKLMGNFEVNRIFRVIFLSLAILFISPVLSIFGVFDIWYDFRNRIKIIRRKQN